MRLAFQYVPGIHLFRRPIDGTFVLVAAFALLAGQLLADYVREGIPRVARLASCRRGGRARWASSRWAVLFSEQTHHGWASLWEVAEGGSAGALVIVRAGAGAHRREAQGDGRGLRRGDGGGRAASGSTPPRA